MCGLLDGGSVPMSKIRIRRIDGVVVSQNQIHETQITRQCPHRGDQIDVIRCDQCGQGKGQDKPVYSCAIHGRCTHRLEQRGQESQEVPTKICIGCQDGPWSQ